METINSKLSIPDYIKKFMRDLPSYKYDTLDEVMQLLSIYRDKSKTELNELIPEIDKLYPKSNLHYSIGPLEEIQLSNSIITILPSVFSRLGDLSIDTSQRDIFKNVKDKINIHIGLLYLLDKSYKNTLPSPYDSFIIDSKIHYMEVLLKYNLCEPETIILYYDLDSKNEDRNKRSNKTRQNLKKLFDNPKTMELRSLESRVKEFLQDNYNLIDIYEKKTGKYPNRHIMGSIKDYESWKLQYNEVSQEQKIKDIELTFKDNLENIFNKNKIDKYVEQTRKLYLKFPFSGSSACGNKISLERDINITDIYNILINNFNETYVRIGEIDFEGEIKLKIQELKKEQKGLSKQDVKDYREELNNLYFDYEDKQLSKIQLIRMSKKRPNIVIPDEPEIPKELMTSNRLLHLNKCMGIYYGLMLQPMNPNYELYGEKRCICYKGDIKVVISSGIYGGVFIPHVIHRSVFELKLNKIEDMEQKVKKICKRIIDTYEWFYFSEKLPIMGVDNFDLEKTNIIRDTKNAYKALKKEFSPYLNGNHHRIDFINSRTNIDKYIINEVENINFGNAVNDSMFFSLSTKKHDKIYDYMGIEGVKSGLYRNIVDFFTLESFKSMREILLSFN
jgi:hypothetical protein